MVRVDVQIVYLFEDRKLKISSFIGTGTYADLIMNCSRNMDFTIVMFVT